MNPSLSRQATTPATYDKGKSTTTLHHDATFDGGLFLHCLFLRRVSGHPRPVGTPARLLWACDQGRIRTPSLSTGWQTGPSNNPVLGVEGVGRSARGRRSRWPRSPARQGWRLSVLKKPSALEKQTRLHLTLFLHGTSENNVLAFESGFPRIRHNFAYIYDSSEWANVMALL